MASQCLQTTVTVDAPWFVSHDILRGEIALQLLCGEGCVALAELTNLSKEPDC